MAYLYMVPQWFFGFGIFMEFLFAIVACLVAVYSFKIYKISYQKESRDFGIGFALISVAYLLKALINTFLLDTLSEGVRALDLGKLNMLGIFGAYGYMALFSLGLVTLVYTASKVKSWRIYVLLVALAAVAIRYSVNSVVAFQAVSTLMLLIMSAHYIEEYMQSKNGKTALVMVAFILLFLSGLGVVTPNFYSSFVVSHLMELAAYIFIMISLFLTIRKHQRK